MGEAGPARPGESNGAAWQQFLQAVRVAQARAEAAVAAADTLGALEEVRVRFLGRRGEVTALLREVGKLPPERRPAAGHEANRLAETLDALLKSRRRALESAALDARLAAERLDVTLPGRPAPRGHLHPIYQVWRELEAIFIAMGYDVAEGPEVEWDALNFVALNIPKDHPARDMQQTFFVTDEILLRTHTSPVQIRYMRERAPQLPLRMVCPGRVFRRDADATHSPMFHQIEGLVVDRGITFGDLKGALLEFAQALYGPEVRIRLRPSYFPFTEPSAEVDVSCALCGGTGCRTCGGSGWLEILGAGMVHPVVLENGGYDPEEVSGFAFGAGIDRMAMLKYGIDDLRRFTTNDLSFLTQF